MMNRNLLIGITAALALTAQGASAQDTWTWNSTVPAGQTLEIKGVNGAIRAVAASGNEVRVRVTKKARRSDVDDVRMVVLEHGNGVTICAVYPNVTGRQPNECAAGSGGRMNVQNNDVSVEWEVQVPRGVHLAARTVNGAVEATGLAGNVIATTVNGSVQVSTNGIARASTVNGRIDATLGRADWNDDLEFETTNGSVVVTINGDLNAHVSASTVNGSIETDYPLEVRGRFSNRRINGTVGSGGRSLSMSTVNGSIELRRQ
jgi:hypothetical protein